MFVAIQIDIAEMAMKIEIAYSSWCAVSRSASPGDPDSPRTSRGGQPLTPSDSRPAPQGARRVASGTCQGPLTT